MIKSPVSITQVKSKIQSLKQSKVEVILNLGRNKYVTYFGVLDKIYPALFTVSPIDKDFKGKTSYSYSEYMCGKVRLKQVKEV